MRELFSLWAYRVRNRSLAAHIASLGSFWCPWGIASHRTPEIGTFAFLAILPPQGRARETGPGPGRAGGPQGPGRACGAVETLAGALARALEEPVGAWGPPEGPAPGGPW